MHISSFWLLIEVLETPYRRSTFSILFTLSFAVLLYRNFRILSDGNLTHRSVFSCTVVFFWLSEIIECSCP